MNDFIIGLFDLVLVVEVKGYVIFNDIGVMIKIELDDLFIVFIELF